MRKLTTSRVPERRGKSASRTAIAISATRKATPLAQDELLVTLPPLEDEGIGTVDLAAGSTAAGLMIAALLKRITKDRTK